MDWSLEFLSSVQYFGGFKEVKKLYKTFGLEPQKEKWPQSHHSIAIDVTTELESDLMKKYIGLILHQSVTPQGHSAKINFH